MIFNVDWDFLISFFYLFKLLIDNSLLHAKYSQLYGNIHYWLIIIGSLWKAYICIMLFFLTYLMIIPTSYHMLYLDGVSEIDNFVSSFNIKTSILYLSVY